MSKYKLTLGPILFNWIVNDWRDFYFKMADNPYISDIYIGEVVCYKRFPFFEVALDEVIQKLTSNNKKVYLSSLSLMLGELEISSARKLIEKYGNNHLIEINDIGLLKLLKNKKHIIGPTINTYNEETAKVLQSQGSTRICLPYELDKKSIQIIAKNTNLETEVFSFGRAPLAIAARCYHARIHNTTKDDCRYVCEKDYDGKVITTLKNEDFLTVNGTQTMSFSYANLINEVCNLNDTGVKYFRLSPHTVDMTKISELFAQVLNKQMESTEAYSKMQELMPNNTKFSNGFYYATEGRKIQEESIE